MDLERFVAALRQLDAAEIATTASVLATTDEDVAWWQATIAIDQELRANRASMAGAAAARRATSALLAAAAAAGLAADSPDVVAVARAAADVARGLTVHASAAHELLASSHLVAA